MSAIISLLESFGADSSTISNVKASLTGGTISVPATSGTPGNLTTPSTYSFTRDLTVGSTGADVTALQNTLKSGGYMTANATGYFGALTKAGVVAWQTAKGVTPAAGYFGPMSQAIFAGAAVGATTVKPTTTIKPTTTTVPTVTAGSW